MSKGENDMTADELVRQVDRGKLMSVAARYVPLQDAEDVVQEAMLKALSHVDRFRGDSRPQSWIHRITINAALDACQRRAKWRQSGDVDLAGDLDTPDGAYAVLAALDSAPAPIVEGLEVCLTDLGYQDQATARGLPVTTIKTRVHRAKRYLQSTL